MIAATYYAMYDSLYALLVQAGVRCRNHACTLAFVGHAFGDSFSPEEMSFYRQALQARIDAQYFVDREADELTVRRLQAEARRTYAKCRAIHVSEVRIKEISLLRTS